MLCIPDTTELDFNGQESAGLGFLNYEARCGMYLHPDVCGHAGSRTAGHARRVDVGARAAQRQRNTPGPEGKHALDRRLRADRRNGRADAADALGLLG